MPIELRYRCASCGVRRNKKIGHGAHTDRCPGCGHEALIDAMSEPLTRCTVCGGTEFFVRKDFPQKLGLSLVIAFGLIASVFYYYERVIATFATLAILVAIDAIIYFFVGKVMVCYKCRAEYRGAAYNSRLEGFDLATSEKYQG